MNCSNPVVLYGSPKFTGVTANADVSSPTTRSQLRTRSVAPPQTEPCIIAITGAGKRRTARSRCSSGSEYANGS